MSELPDGWQRIALGEVVESAVDGPFGSNLKTEHYVGSPGVRVIRLQNIGAGYFDDQDRVYVSAAHARTLDRHAVHSGDLLVASLGDVNHPVARACIYPEGLAPAIVKADCFRLRPATDLASSGYLTLTLNHPSSRRGIEGYFQGVTRDRINLSALLRFRIPMPPLREQRRIAEIFDALDVEVNCVRQLTGKMRATRKALLEAELKTIATHSEAFPLKELSLGSGEYGSNSPSVSHSENLPRYVRITDIDGDGRLRKDSMVSHPEAGSAPYLLRDGDLLIARTGFTTGKTLLFREAYGRCIFAGYLVRFRLDASKVDPRYIFLWTRSDEFSRWVNRTFREVGQRNISATEYGGHFIPVPSLEVQRRLVDRIEYFDSLIENHQRRCCRLSEVKAGLAEDLLTGRVRV